MSTARRTIREIYGRLERAYGPQHWWPARTATEVAVGAILTQNTAWKNVERAVINLREAGVLSWNALRKLSERKLATLIRPAGTYRVKARRLKALVNRICDDHGGSLRRLLAGDLESARRRLLLIHGIGPETADAILLYAANRPTFVVDAYTKRVLRRHGVVSDCDDYEKIQGLFHTALEPDSKVFNEYHALLVAVGKRHCRARAQCESCPLAAMPHDEML